MNRIAFISTNKSSWGGSEYLWYNTAIRLSESGKLVKASIPRWKNIPQEMKTFEVKGIDLKYNTDTSGIKKLVNRFLPKTLQTDYSDDGFKFLNKFKPDLVVINQGGNTGGINLMEYCINNNFQFVTISQAANEAKWPSEALNIRLSNALPRALKNYFVSKANIKLTEMQIGQKIRNSKVVFNPFNVAFENDLRYPEVNENYILANVACYDIYAKGQDILFQVLNEQKWRNRNLVVMLYGKGKHTYSINKLINYYNLDKVKMAGHVSPVDIWKRSHALILASRYGGLPLALVEAMLCGRAGIVTKVSGNPEIITDNVNGFLAKAPATEFIDEALERAWVRRDEWKFIGEKAKEYSRSIIPKDPINQFCSELLNLRN